MLYTRTGRGGVAGHVGRNESSERIIAVGAIKRAHRVQCLREKSPWESKRPVSRPYEGGDRSRDQLPIWNSGNRNAAHRIFSFVINDAEAISSRVNRVNRG